MGGYGSGRPAERLTVEACLRLDVNQLRRQGYLRSGVLSRWSWTREGEEIASLEVLGSSGALYLHRIDQRRANFGYGDGRQIEHAISMAWTLCNYGGSRPWFLCPNCHHRASKLYLPVGGRHFLCRRCYRLGYESRRESLEWRMRRKAAKLWRRLGRDPDNERIPPKPTGMHWRTYDKLVTDAWNAEELAERYFVADAIGRFRLQLSELGCRSGLRI